ncbi:MAG: HAMP domain-containing sensor histidine kinase [Pseudomonadales bacterium]|nr:HAMP domain-containing sensor histidine kinase [Pseudomonadales bacterium]
MNSDFDFSLLLASAVHDMKNSIGMLLSTVEQLDQSDISEDKDSQSKLALLHAEASRINNDLVHLLGIYRLDQDQLCLNYQECFVFDIFQDQVVNNEIIFRSENLKIEIDYNDDLSWFFDEQLVADVIGNVLINAAKYAKSLIIIKAEIIDAFLKISILDDGNGYPEKMLSNPDELKNGLDFASGSTKLGLFFASRIASEHQKGEQRGYIQLENYDGGGMFSLWLP